MAIGFVSNQNRIQRTVVISDCEMSGVAADRKAIKSTSRNLFDTTPCVFEQQQQELPLSQRRRSKPKSGVKAGSNFFRHLPLSWGDAYDGSQSQCKQRGLKLR